MRVVNKKKPFHQLAAKFLPISRQISGIDADDTTVQSQSEYWMLKIWDI